MGGQENHEQKESKRKRQVLSIMKGIYSQGRYLEK